MVRHGFKARPSVLAPSDKTRTLFRIEDADGRVVARIAAPDATRAMALFWRRQGCRDLAAYLPAPAPTAAPPHAAALQGSIDMARTRLGPRLGPRLGLDQLKLPAIAEQQAARSPRPRRGAAPVAGPGPVPVPGQDDLFARPAAPLPVPVPVSDRAPHGPAEPPAPRRQVTHLDADTVQLTRVHHRGLQPSDPPDSFLYHIAGAQRADAMLRDGLTLSRRDPLLLTERGGVPYWLSLLADDADLLDDAAAGIVVLRLKRFMVDDLIEDDPDSTRSSGTPCYFLTGG